MDKPMKELRKIIEEKHDNLCLQCGEIMKPEFYPVIGDYIQTDTYFICPHCGYVCMFTLQPEFMGRQMTKLAISN